MPAQVIRSLLLFALLPGLASAATDVVADSPPELKRLHVLVVIDSAARDLAYSVRIDRERIEHLLMTTIPADRYRLTVLEGKKATARQILTYYRNLRTAPGEGLLFYYAGHGARDEKTGKPFFDLRVGGPLLREDLIRHMEARQTELVLLLTDCCSTPQPLKGPGVTPRAGGPARTLHPTVRQLLFQARGTIDVTAATDNSSWSDNLKGGVFTRSICRMLRQPVRSVDLNKDGFVTWREFYPQLRDETQSLFGVWRKEMIARGERVEERKQVPHAFRLGRSLGVVALENATTEQRSYRWRWSDQTEWNEVVLAPDQRKLHTRLISEGQRVLPQLEVQFSGRTRSALLKPVEWTGNGEPTEPTRVIRIRTR